MLIPFVVHGSEASEIAWGNGSPGAVSAGGGLPAFERASACLELEPLEH